MNPLPPLTDQEYEALKADIAERGVLVPVVRDQTGDLVDGHHRQRAALELGVPCPVNQIEIPAGIERLHVQIALNLRRRHLAPSERTKVEKELREEGVSLRMIADLTGAAPNTVRAGVQDDTPAQVTGRDGKKYPATATDFAARREQVASLQDEGVSPDDIAATLGISRRTVYNDFRAIRKQGLEAVGAPVTPPPKAKPNGYTEGQSLRGLRDTAVQIEALTDALVSGHKGDWARLRSHPDAQQWFALIGECLPHLSTVLKRAVREWKESA